MYVRTDTIQNEVETERGIMYLDEAEIIIRKTITVSHRSFSDHLAQIATQITLCYIRTYVQ